MRISLGVGALKSPFVKGDLGGFSSAYEIPARPPRLSESDGGQVNPAPTKRVDLPVVGAGFTPARIGCWSLQIAHFRY